MPRARRNRDLGVRRPGRGARVHTPSSPAPPAPRRWLGGKRRRPPSAAPGSAAAAAARGAPGWARPPPRAVGWAPARRLANGPHGECRWLPAPAATRASSRGPSPPGFLLPSPRLPLPATPTPTQRRPQAGGEAPGGRGTLWSALRRQRAEPLSAHSPHPHTHTRLAGVRPGQVTSLCCSPCLGAGSVLPSTDSQTHSSLPTVCLSLALSLSLSHTYT